MDSSPAFLESRAVIGSVVLILSVFGMGANILISFSKTAPSKRLMGSLILASTVFLFPSFVVIVPCAFSFCPYYDENWLNFLSTPDTIGYYVYQITLVHILLDRFLFFCAPKACKLAQKYEVYISLLIWIFVVTLTVTEWFFFCRKTFDVANLRIRFAVKGDGYAFLNIHIFISYGAPILLAIISIIVFTKIRIVHKTLQSRRLKEEVYLMIQYSFVSAFSWFGGFCFYLLPQLQSLFGSKLTLLPLITSLVSLTCHSYIFIFSHRKIRREFFKHFAPKKVHFSVSPVSDGRTLTTTYNMRSLA